MKNGYICTCPKSPLLSARELCFFLRTTRSGVYRLRRQKKIGYVKITRATVFYDKKEMMQYNEQSNGWLN